MKEDSETQGGVDTEQSKQQLQLALPEPSAVNQVNSAVQQDPDRVAISQQGLLSILQALEHQQNPQSFKLWPSLSSTISIHLMHSCATASQTGMHTSL